MTIYDNNGILEIIPENEREIDFIETEQGENGKTFVPLKSVTGNYFHISEGNEKTGPAWNYNLSIELTCNHNCECYLKGVCYACSGCYCFIHNQMMYSENVAYLKNHSVAEILTTFQMAIDSNKNIRLFRFFTCGDIPNTRFVDIMAGVARNNPGMKFWAYTKKYAIVNKWIDENGRLPESLVILFSHWLNSDGSYYPMENPHNLPTSEFIPIGQEHLSETVTHICPCSDPNVIANCANCEHACYTLKTGQSMALLEHSTKATKTRDKALKTAKKELKKATKKATKKGA